MPLKVEAFYDVNQVPTTCAICGRSTSGRFSPPVRFILMEDEDKIGETCERCAYGSTELWKVALREYSARLETQAAVLRSLALQCDDAEPAPEGIAEQIVRDNASRRPPFPPRPYGR